MQPLSFCLLHEDLYLYFLKGDPPHLALIPFLSRLQPFFRKLKMKDQYMFLCSLGFQTEWSTWRR